MRDEALFELLDRIINHVYFHADGIIPMHGSIGSVGAMRFHFRRESYGPIHRLSRWPDSDWHAIIEMDFLGLVRKQKPDVSDVREIEGSSDAFMRDMIYVKMALENDD